MSAVSATFQRAADAITSIQQKLGDGKPVNLANEVQAKTLLPADLHAAKVLNREELQTKAAELLAQGTEKPMADAMTVGDEVAVVATLERTVQRRYMSRIRVMAHASSRAAGLANPQSVVNFGWKELLARPV